MKKLIFSVHEKYQVYRLSSGRTAQRYSSVWMKIILDAKAIDQKFSMAHRVTWHLRLLRQWKCLKALKNFYQVSELNRYDAINLLRLYFMLRFYSGNSYILMICFVYVVVSVFVFFFFLVSRIEKGKLKEVVWLETRHLHAHLPSWALNGAMAFTWLLKVGQSQWIDSCRRCGAWMRGKFPMRGN